MCTEWANFSGGFLKGTLKNAGKQGGRLRLIAAALAGFFYQMMIAPHAWSFGSGACPLPNQEAKAQPAAIFGKDDRRDLPENYSALEGKIGMIYEPVSQTLCTGFCVAPDIIATASHCLFQPKGSKLPDISALSFRLDYGKVSLSSGLVGSRTGRAKNFVAVGTTKFNQEPPLSAPRDWALAKLDNPICRFGVLDVAAKPVNELIKAAADKRIFQVAYHWDFKHWKLAYSGACTISQNFNNLPWRAIQQHFSDPDELVLHDCDTGGASSGSPLLMETPSGPVAIAINVGTYTRTRLFLRQSRVIKRMPPDIIANTAVNAHAFKHVIQELAKAQIIDDPEDIRRLQNEMKARGLYSAKVDGEIGRSLRTAIRSFQAANGLPVTGLATRKLLEQLSTDRVRPRIDYSTAHGTRQ